MAMQPVSEPEEWRPVPNRPDYEASSLGRVRSLDRVVLTKNGRQVRHHGRMLKGRQGGTSPYLVISLRNHDSGSFTHHLVHSVVCAAFHGPRPSRGHEVAHYDGDPLNNRPDNLRWATRVENLADKVRHGTQLTGSRNHKAILCEEDVHAIRSLYATRRFTHQAIANLFKVSGPTVTLIVKRVNWKHLP